MSLLTCRRRGVGKVTERFLMTDQSNPEAFAICLAQGWCSAEGMTYEDAARITDIAQYFMESGIKTFDEFEYFTSANVPAGSFRDCSSLTSIRLPSNITIIGNSAFRGCTVLSSIDIKEGVNFIDQSAFRDCNALTSIVLPSTVETIQNQTFYYARNFSACYIKATNPPSLGSAVFSGSKITANTGAIYVPSVSVGTYQSAGGWSTYSSRIQAIPT